MSNRGKMPSKSAIINHWFDILVNKYNKDVLGCYDKDSKNCCFACETITRTMRCHIIPVCNGGDNNVNNLHLLCDECHLESEYFDREDIYFEWFKFKDYNNSGSELRIMNKARFLISLHNKGEKKMVDYYLEKLNKLEIK